MRTHKRHPSKTAIHVKNDILRALLNLDYKRLSPKLERVDLQRGEIIYKADQRIDHVFFPETAAVAMIDTMEDGATVEVGIIGHEGMVGINIFLGCLATPDKAMTTFGGAPF